MLQQKKASNVFYDLKNIGFDDGEIDSSHSDDEKVNVKEMVFDIADKKMTKYELEEQAQQKLNEYQIIRLLGSGAYAQVKLAQHKKTK